MSRTESDFDDITADTGYTLQTADEEFEGDFIDYEQQLPFRYLTENFISRPWFSENCDIEENILEFDYSYGYDCKKPYNLLNVDERTIIFASGNLIHFFDAETREVWFRRSAYGGGIGHIAKNYHPDYPHIAIAENGINPPIIIYEWPSMDIMCVLKEGTTRRYTHLDYSPNGKLLVSQGGDPDYMITVWNWPKSMILLRTKSYVNDVQSVMFAPEVPGQITSCGIAHIKFWKMAKTFTGLKLQGELGRFGKTEYSDIVGIYPMPDEKVISGCYWGNILVWDEGLIKLEVTRRGRKKCHEGPIVQIDYKDGELWTVGMDGRVRIWYYDTIDQADPPDEDRVVEMEPTYDFYTPNAEFMCICKQYEDPENTFYFAQDGKGGIWRIDLSTDSENIAESERLLKCHAGIAESLSVCPWGNYFCTLGNGGRLHLYNYVTRTLLLIHPFPTMGCCVIWVPLDIDPSGEVLIVSLTDGAVRVVILKISEEINESKLSVIQLTKPHTSRITMMKLNRPGNIFVTAAEDSTMFVYQVIKGNGYRYMELIPIGFIPTPDIVVCMTWHKDLDNTIILGCIHGEIMTVEVPLRPQYYTTITYILHVEPIIQKFTSYKAQIRRNIKLKEIAAKKAAKRLVKLEALEKFRKENPGLDIEEEVFLIDSESEEILEPLYIPKIPNKILWIQHTADDTLWLSVGGYDAGYIYEYKIGQTEEVPYKFTLIHHGDDIEINNYAYSKNGEYLIFAMEDGSIRVNRNNHKNWRNLSNYWQLNMHDNFNGFIAGMQFSYDDSYFITCGHDGNIFTFRFYSDESSDDSEIHMQRHIPEEHVIKAVEDIDCEEMLSLEETIVKAEEDRINDVANCNKDIYLEILERLREEYEDVLARNDALPESQRIPLEELELDSRVTDNLDEKLKADEYLVERKLAFDVEKSNILLTKMREHFLLSLDMYPITVKSVKSKTMVQCLPMRSLGYDFDNLLAEVDLKIAEAELKGRAPERPPATITKAVSAAADVQHLEYFLVGLSPEIIKYRLGPKITRVLGKYRKRRKIREDRAREWEAFNATKPTVASSDADDVATLKQAEDTIGDFKLKSAPDYRVPRHLRESTFKKYKELLLVRERHYNLSHDFNETVYRLRDDKKELLNFLERQTKALLKIHEEIDEKDWCFGPDLFHMTLEEDFPDREFEVNVETILSVNVPEEKTLIPRMPIPDRLEREVLQTMPHVNDEEKEVETDWETRLKRIRYRKMIFYQAENIKYMELAIEEFDMKVQNERLRRMEISVDSNLVTLHLLTLNQELLILKDCEAKEDTLSDLVHANMIELMDIQDLIEGVNSEIEVAKKDISKLEEKEKEIQRNFMSATSENKFFDFLRRIFKKKYKPPKVQTDSDSDSDSSSSSSEESEDADAESLDSKDFGIIRLDENVCPKGCDPNIYDLTFQLRNQRHGVELEVRELTRKIDVHKKEFETYTKQAKILQSSLKRSQDELDTFQREKQHKLNKIMCTVILRLDQIQNISERGNMNLIKDSLVFSKHTLSNLYKRVGELYMETVQQRSKHKLSVKHLMKMKVDFSHMQSTMKSIRREIADEMTIQFGGPVNIDELQEFLLKKLIFNLKLSMIDIKSMFIKELEYWYDIHKVKQKHLMQVFKENTIKFDLLTMITKEKFDLEKIIEHQTDLRNNFEDVVQMANKLKSDINKLKEVAKDQERDIETLKLEIKLYRTKGYTIKPEHPPTIQIEEVDEEEEEEESVIPDWEYMEEYKFTEAYAKEYWKDLKDKEAFKLRQDVLINIIEELFDNIDREIDKNSVIKLLKSVISDVMNKCDVEQIISDILAAIPPPHTDDQQSLIELTAEKLYSIEDNEFDEEIVMQSKEILMEILNDILNNVGLNSVERFGNLVNTLTENLPLDVIMAEENMSCIVDTIQRSRMVLNEEAINEMGSMTDVLSWESRTLFSEIVFKITDLRK
ncbi:PREDICTED: uncharacterized protein LOC108567166 [Nicrophorus vespilloides]|uniref:Uncharacterized protein LOC108567166 n=1 Tax=Nicrophorus vespilloides TaxID=110193 RepID=A0ABM1N819_NICVS|nr:PREDICTED: uncharacterized protein LOC108567166 [Nicrophorus vespilloides]